MSDYERIEEIYSKARLIADLEERRKFVEEECGDDEQFFSEVWLLCVAEMRVREGRDQLKQGQIIGNYRIMRPLGRGMLASVYLATHRIIGHTAAIKVFKKAAISVEGEEVWRRDSDILALLRHDSIARFFDAGLARGKVPYVIMEYVDGVHIDKYCDDDKLSVRDRLKLFRELCAVIEYIHSHNVVHLDIKPTNVLVSTFPHRRIKLIDFSAGKLLHIQGVNEYLSASQFSIAFSSNYASPEQINEKRELIGPHSDVYSLGALLYEMLSGCPPLEMEDIDLGEKQRVINNEYPVPPSKRITDLSMPGGNGEGEKSQKSYDLKAICNNRGFQPQQLTKALSGDVDLIVMKCLEKERNKRYRSVADLGDDIDRFLSGRPLKARGGGWPYKFKKFVSRLLGAQPGMLGWDKWRMPAMRIATVLALTSAVGFFLYLTRQNPKPLPRIDIASSPTRVAYFGSNGQLLDLEAYRAHRIQYLNDDIFLDLVLVADKPERFRMGTADSALDIKQRFPEEFPQHEVAVQPFYLGRAEVTRAQWLAVYALPIVNVPLPRTPWKDSEDPRAKDDIGLPVTHVNFIQAVEFCDRLSRATGLKYRLPTEAEWEYGCRSGNDSAYGFGDQLQANFANFKPSGGAVRLDQMEFANRFGLFNMSGNVWEWVQDRWHRDYSNNPPKDGSAWDTRVTVPESNEGLRVIRGGSYDKEPAYCRCASRTIGRELLGVNSQVGFRVALSAD
jgi:formylglycine-generating enzyme required for sulfatase activity/serine/threonine protein kinase